MRLSQHPDFAQAIVQAAEHFAERGLRPALIEKDYYVTETLRIMASTVGDKIIFKGGTSLSKGWNLIQRFSEDVDIFLDPRAFDPPLGTNGINRELAYAQAFGGPGEVASSVLVEAGTASGREPTADVEIRSYLGTFLADRGLSLGAEDERGFSMRLLHFRRTFVEKLFAIHAKVEILKRTGRPIGSYARHYYDLSELATRPEVTEMLGSDEYAAIKADYDAISREHFDRSYIPPDDMRFATSEALFPPNVLRRALGAEYEAQCRQLCFGPYPTWPDVLERFADLRDRL
jgi:hypothetical protein